MAVKVTRTPFANAYYLTDDSRATLNAYNRAYRLRLKVLRNIRRLDTKVTPVQARPPELMSNTLFAPL